MAGLHPIDRELLYFLCSCAHHRVRVVRIKAPRAAALRRLRYAGLISFDGFEPSLSALADWRALRNQTPVPRDSEAPAEPPEPEAAAEGGGAARCVAPPPEAEAKFLERLLACFSDEFEPLSAVAQRNGSTSTAKIVTFARRLRLQGLVEFDPPRSGRIYSLWRRARPPLGLSQDELAELPPKLISQLSKPAQAQVGRAKRSRQHKENAPLGDRRYAVNREKSDPARAMPAAEPPGRHQADEREAAPAASPAGQPRAIANTRGESGTAREASGAVESTVAKRIKDRSPPIQPPPSSFSPEKQDFLRANAARLRAGRAKAAAFLDSGKTSQDAGSVSLRIEARKLEVQRAEETRLACPIEQAKTMIRRKTRHAVFGAEVSMGEAGKGRFFIGNKLVSKAELLAMAARLAA